MVTNLPGQPKVSDIIVSKIKDSSAALQSARLYPFTGDTQLIAYSYNGEDARYHSGTDADDKVVSDDQLSEVTITTKTLYKVLKFDDRQWEDKAVVRNSIESQTPFDLYRTLDKDAAAGRSLVPTSAFGGYTATPLTVDGTAESVLAASDVIAANGYRATHAILDNSFEPVLREAFVQGTNTNQLGVNISDGIKVGNVTVYFRALGARVGVVGDFDKMVVAYNNNLNVVHYLHTNDFGLGLQNKNAIKVSWQVGIGVIDQAAFQPVTLATPGE